MTGKTLADYENEIEVHESILFKRWFAFVKALIDLLDVKLTNEIYRELVEEHIEEVKDRLTQIYYGKMYWVELSDIGKEELRLAFEEKVSDAEGNETFTVIVDDTILRQKLDGAALYLNEILGLIRLDKESSK